MGVASLVILIMKMEVIVRDYNSTDNAISADHGNDEKNEMLTLMSAELMITASEVSVSEVLGAVGVVQRLVVGL